MAKTIQYHLHGQGFSGRAVRVRRLPPSELQELGSKATQIAGPQNKDADPEVRAIAYRAQEVEEGISAMLASFTQPVTPEDLAPPKKEALDAAHVDVKWTKVAPGSIASGELDLDDIFTAKDVAMLAAIYRRLHEASKEEADAIMGKAVEVASD